MKAEALRSRLTEAQFQSMVTDLARARGWLVHHDRRQDFGIGGDAGFPDLVLARGGSVIFAELKSRSGKVSADQEAWLLELGHQHTPAPPPGEYEHYAVVWRPAQWNEIQKVLA